MKISLDQLAGQLTKSLFPLYIVSGDETLLVNEACDKIRLRAKQLGFEERSCFVVENANFSAENLLLATDNYSLFSEKKFIDLYCLTEKIPETLAKALLDYMESPREGVCIVLRCGKLTQAQQQLAWFKKIMDKIAFIQVWPIELARLPQWIGQRLAQYKLTAEPAALLLMAKLGENNLFSIVQAIEKLHILYGEGHLSREQISVLIHDQSRFQLFDLVEPVLLGDAARALKMLQRLELEGEEASLVLWVMCKEIRELVSSVRPPMLERKKQAITRALSRHSKHDWCKHLLKALEIDYLIKGARSGSVWDALQGWVAEMAS